MISLLLQSVVTLESYLCMFACGFRLVQNAGEFVVTFPRAYHSGFSHGKALIRVCPVPVLNPSSLLILLYINIFMIIETCLTCLFDISILGFNCGEAANIATPEWLRVAKEAAIRRAAINCPPMVSHFQLLYDLALSLCSRFVFSLKLNAFLFEFSYFVLNVYYLQAWSLISVLEILSS